MLRVELKDRVVYVKELKFKTFKKLFSVITEVLNDLTTGNLQVEKYLDRAVEIIASMTELKPEEVEELSGTDALKLLNACIDRIREDTAFLQQLKELTDKLNQLTPSQKP